jgi:hypothetical protein
MHRLSVVVFVVSTLITVGQTKYRFERPSRVVEIKHGKIQGTLVELPIVPTSTGPPTPSGDGDISFEDDAQDPQVKPLNRTTRLLVTVLQRCLGKAYRTIKARR